MRQHNQSLETVVSVMLPCSEAAPSNRRRWDSRAKYCAVVRRLFIVLFAASGQHSQDFLRRSAASSSGAAMSVSQLHAAACSLVIRLRESKFPSDFETPPLPSAPPCFTTSLSMLRTRHHHKGGRLPWRACSEISGAVLRLKARPTCCLATLFSTVVKCARRSWL